MAHWEPWIGSRVGGGIRVEVFIATSLMSAFAGFAAGRMAAATSELWVELVSVGFSGIFISVALLIVHLAGGVEMIVSGHGLIIRRRKFLGPSMTEYVVDWARVVLVRWGPLTRFLEVQARPDGQKEVQAFWTTGRWLGRHATRKFLAACRMSGIPTQTVP